MLVVCPNSNLLALEGQGQEEGLVAKPLDYRLADQLPMINHHVSEGVLV